MKVFNNGLCTWETLEGNNYFQRKVTLTGGLLRKESDIFSTAVVLLQWFFAMPLHNFAVALFSGCMPVNQSDKRLSAAPFSPALE